jgi:hypothetical protein
MSTNKIIANTRTGFAAVPNDFLRDKKISVQAKGTAAFLQSLPHGWKIHKDWVQKELGFKQRLWTKIAKQLVQHGCLKMYQGGAEGGSYYTFSFWNYEDSFLKTDCAKKASTLKSDSRKKASLRKKDYVQKKNYINNKQEEDVVVDFKMIERLKKHNVSQLMSNRWVKAYGYAKILEKLNMLDDKQKNGTSPENPAGWLNVALRDDFKTSSKPKKQSSSNPYPTAEETSDYLSKRGY